MRYSCRFTLSAFHSRSASFLLSSTFPLFSFFSLLHFFHCLFYFTTAFLFSPSLPLSVFSLFSSPRSSRVHITSTVELMAESSCPIMWSRGSWVLTCFHDVTFCTSFSVQALACARRVISVTGTRWKSRGCLASSCLCFHFFLSSRVSCSEYGRWFSFGSHIHIVNSLNRCGPVTIRQSVASTNASINRARSEEQKETKNVTREIPCQRCV